MLSFPPMEIHCPDVCGSESLDRLSRAHVVDEKYAEKDRFYRFPFSA